MKLIPSQTVKEYCKECLGLSIFETDKVLNCQGDQALSGACPLHPYRMGKRISVKIFRKFCLQCMGGSMRMVDECESEKCYMLPYRMGRNPSRAGHGFAARSKEA